MKPIDMPYMLHALADEPDIDRAGLRRDLTDALGSAGSDDPAPMIDILVRHRLLRRFATPSRGGYRYDADWREILDLLAAIGSVELSTARLFEGHLNALQLVAHYGSAAQQARVLDTVVAGGLLGVWGADGTDPVRLRPTGLERWALAGAKRYASGAGLVRMALVPITDAATDAMHLLLLAVDDPARVDLSGWDMRGMRRSISGSYRFDGLSVTPAERVGAPDDYRREPFFVGGIWRCAAAQLGAIEAIVRILAAELARTGRDGHPLQMARIGEAVIEARTARLWIEDSAGRVETAPAGEEEIERAVALAAYARLVTETAAMRVIDLCERGLGLGSFAHGHPVEALRRDLAVYVRQANPDAVLLQHGRVLARGLVDEA